MIWLKFAAIQLVMLVATVAGLVILLPACVFKRWTMFQCLGADDRDWHFIYALSIKDKRQIDHWNSILLNLVYGNPEDGVSGQQALVWTSDGKQVPYMPGAPAWWRAYCWSALRNSCDNLKYVFADPKGPLKTFKLFGRTCKIGWQVENGYNVPVGSL